MKKLKPFAKIMLLFLCVISSNICFAKYHQAGKYADQVELSNGKSVGFVFHLPEGFNESDSYPALIGPGASKVDDENGFFWQFNPTGNGWVIIETPAMYELSDQLGAEAINKIFDFMLKHFKIEHKKFHGIGWSANSGQAFKRAIAVADRFISITGLPGHPREINKKAIQQLAKMKVNFIVGENDNYWLKKSREAHQKLLKAEVDSHLEIIPNGGHVLRQLIDQPLFKKLDQLR